MLSIVLALAAGAAFAADPIPDEVFARHARAQIPDFVADVNRAFGIRLEVDLDTVRVPPLHPGDLLQPTLLGYTAAFYLIPTRAFTTCRRVEATLTDRATTLTFYVRAFDSHVRLVRSCQAGDVRPPRVQIDGLAEKPMDLPDDEILTLARPLVAALVRDQGAGAAIAPTRPRVVTPWLAWMLPVTDDAGFRDLAPNRTCRRIDVDLDQNRRGTVYLDVAFDEADALPGVAREYQTLINDARRLRQYRAALVRGCGPKARRLSPALYVARVARRAP